MTPHTSQARDDDAADLREASAFTIGMAAYLYLAPWVHMPLVRWLDFGGASRRARINEFNHSPSLEGPRASGSEEPNNDVYCSHAWVDVGPDPVILSVPDMRDRFFGFEICSFNSDSFAHVGQRFTQGRARHVAIVGPDWKGQLPPGVTALAASPTPWVYVVGRVLAHLPEDVATIAELQSKFALTPLSHWRKPNAPNVPSPEIWKPADDHEDPLAAWKTVNRSLRENPPPDCDAPMFETFARFGIGPGLDVGVQDDATKHGLARAAQAARTLIDKAFADAKGRRRVNGWLYPPQSAGRITPTQDWLMRAVQNQYGVVADNPHEIIELKLATDATGAPLSGANRYALRFNSGETPPAKAAWSMTMYAGDRTLVDNPIDRYSITDRTLGVRRDGDDALTIQLQKDAPNQGEANNWLPTPEGLFYLILRIYLPDESVINQSWRPPCAQKLA